MPTVVGQECQHASICGNNEGTAGFVISILAFVIFKLDLERYQLPRTDKWTGCFGARYVFSAAIVFAPLNYHTRRIAPPTIMSTMVKHPPGPPMTLTDMRHRGRT